jgi:hypothetical protein
MDCLYCNLELGVSLEEAREEGNDFLSFRSCHSNNGNLLLGQLDWINYDAHFPININYLSFYNGLLYPLLSNKHLYYYNTLLTGFFYLGVYLSSSFLIFFFSKR